MNRNLTPENKKNLFDLKKLQLQAKLMKTIGENSSSIDIAVLKKIKVGIACLQAGRNMPLNMSEYNKVIVSSQSIFDGVQSLENASDALGGEDLKGESNE